MNAVVIATSAGRFTLALTVGEFDSGLEAELCADTIMSALAECERDCGAEYVTEH